MKLCTKCNTDKSDDDFYRRSDTGRLRSHCKKCMNRKVLDRYHSDDKVKSAHRESSWRHQIKKNYGMTEADYLSMLDNQGGKCTICGANHLGILPYKLCIDHNHATGEVRGLLCNECNAMLGHAKDEVRILELGIAYLKERGSYGKEVGI